MCLVPQRLEHFLLPFVDRVPSPVLEGAAACPHPQLGCCPPPWDESTTPGHGGNTLTVVISLLAGRGWASP